MTCACVIGAGFGGLALAIRLQAGGIATTLVEAREAPGGAAHTVTREGFTFAGGPTLLADRASFAELWALAGADFAAEIPTTGPDPLYRLFWQDGTIWDMPASEHALRAAIASFAPGDLAGYEDYAAFARRAQADAWAALGDAAMLEWRGLARASPRLLALQPWRSLHARLARGIESEKLRQVLSLPPLLLGGNPLRVSALHAALHAVERDGLWTMRGGAAALAAAMAALFTRIGGNLRLGDAVTRIHTLGAQASEVETASGWRERFDAVASGADLIHTYRHLLGETPHGAAMAQRLARKAWSPGVFTLHLGVAGEFPAIAEHSILFGPRWEGLLTDIFDHGVLPRDVAFHLHHASATDPKAAPKGCAAFTATMPVPHLGQLPVDWGEVGPLLAGRLRDAIATRLIPDLTDRLLTQCHFAPPDFANGFGWHKGAAWSLAPLASQSGPARARRRDKVIGNLYLVGAGTHPGAGVPAVLAGAKATAALMIDALKL